MPIVLSYHFRSGRSFTARLQMSESQLRDNLQRGNIVEDSIDGRYLAPKLPTYQLLTAAYRKNVSRETNA